MKMTLKKIYLQGKSNEYLFISIKVEYGYEGEMYDDMIKLNFQTKKKELFLTLTMNNPGIGLVAERISTILSNIDINSDKIINHSEYIVKSISSQVDLEYDSSLFISNPARKERVEE
jgi:hypothetical protein